ncbi:MAG: GAF domain-containing protein [Anaerolineales bacterium]|nr:GAF domain-containing protein [Anaerolineales bacterium]
MEDELRHPNPGTPTLQRLHDLELLEQIGRDVTSTLDLDRVLNLILDRVKAALGAEAASVLFIEPDSNALVFRAAASANAELLLQRRIPPGRGIAGWVARHGMPIVVVDPSHDPRFYNEIDRIDGFVTRSILAVPLKNQDRLLGVLEALNKRDGTFSEDDVRLLQLVATWAAVAIDNARLYSEATQRARELAIRNEVSQLLSTATDLQSLLDSITTHLSEIAGSTACLILLGDMTVVAPEPVSCFLNGRLIPAVDPHLDRLIALLRRDVSTTHPTIIADLMASGHLAADEASHAPARSLMVLPLLVGEAPQGMVLLGHNAPGRFSQRDVDRVLPLVQQVALAVRKVQMTENLTEMVDARTSELRHEQARLRMIHEIGQVTVSSLDPATLLRAAAYKIRDAFAYQRVSIRTKSQTELTLIADTDGPNGIPTMPIPISADSLACRVAAQAQHRPVSDPTTKSQPDPGNDPVKGSELVLPLDSQGELLGVLEVRSRFQASFDQDDVSTLETIAGRLTMALRNARLFEQVARSKHEWEATFDSIAEGVVLHDDQMIVRRVNRSLADMLETTAEALVGRDVVDAICGAQSTDGEVLRAHPSQPLTTELTEPRRRRTLATTGYPIARPDGSAAGRVLVLRDVTDERVWRSRMLQTEKLASLGQLSAGIAHEINNPLGFIHSNLNTLSRYASDLRTVFLAYHTVFAGDPRLTECERDIDVEYLLQDGDLAITESQEGVERVQSIVTGLKNFARADESTEMKDADLHAALETALKIAWNEIKYKATVEKDYGTLPLVRCNLYRIGQVFINLLVNAAQAIQADGRITLRTRADAEWVEISIQDTGYGITPENMPKLFDPFFTTKEIGQGTGLGLSVVYGIVHEHGGQIDVASRTGQGTTFTIYLPIAGPEASGVVADKEFANEH